MLKLNKQEQIPIVLVGLGKMGQNHLRVVLKNENFELKAVVDPAISQREIPDHPSIKTYHSLGELEESNIDYSCVLIASPTQTHFEIAQHFLKRKKHLLIEKPLSYSYDQCCKLNEEAIKTKMILAVGHVERFNPAVLKLIEVIKSGQLGTIIHISITRVGGYPQEINKGDNVLLDLAVHDIDVLRLILGKLRVIASVCHRTLNQDIYDTSEILLDNQSGVSASIHVNWITPTKIRTIRVTGSRGVCFVDYILQTCELIGGDLLQTTPKLKQDFQSLINQYRNSDKVHFGIQKDEPLKVQLRAFYKALLGDPSDICNAKDAGLAVLLAEKAFSHKKNHLNENGFY